MDGLRVWSRAPGPNYTRTYPGETPLPTLTEIKARKLLAAHQIQHVEDDLTEMVRHGLDGSIMMVINFEDWQLVHPSALADRSANIIVEEEDVARVKQKLQSDGSFVQKTSEEFVAWVNSRDRH
jgi:hypothetical protein